MLAFEDRVPVETKLESGSLKFFRAVHNYVKTVLGIGIGVDAIALLVAVPAAYHTWMEAAQAQEKEFAGV